MSEKSYATALQEIEDSLGLTFEVWHTGGGCTANHAFTEGGFYVLLTDGDAQLLADDREMHQGLMVGLYSTRTDEMLVWVYTRHITAAELVLPMLRRALDLYREHRPVSELEQIVEQFEGR
ncbi:hypothetical protein [Gordonia alkanivorans]|uniref:hypothetical protein n=1 Tax=Gordonia alkanivorans TaxID=84096 RepID=UPI0004BA4E93|nr:hypothetical protein [Gordonia alkanivorans]